MKTARYYAELMALKGIISEANVTETERFFLLYMEGFREQLVKDSNLTTKSKEQQSDEYRDYMG